MKEFARKFLIPLWFHPRTKYEDYKEMRKALSFISTFTVIISIQPVFAVDYVACREMLRTKNEMLNNARDTEGKFLGNITTQNCDGIPITDYRGYIDFSKKDKCYEDNLSLYKNTHKPLLKLKIGILLPEMKTPSSEFYSSEAINWLKAGNKVILDMKKANCPYQ